jgi:uncharacterized protein (TIGR02284 family)
MINDYEATRPITEDAYVSGEGDNDSTISTLNGLITICKDGMEGFNDAAEGVERSDLKSMFQEYAAQRQMFASELQSLVQTLGGDPEDSSSFAGTLHRGWLNVKSAITGGDEAAILNECERGEDSAKKAYKDALEENLPSYVRDTVQTQSEAVQAAHDRVRALRDAANNKSTSAGTNR